MTNLGRDLALSLSPCAFMSAAGMAPDNWQRTFLNSTADRLLLCCCRQSGKSTVTAALATWTAAYQPGSLILIVAPSERQSVETFRKILVFHKLVAETDPEAESSQRIELANGSRVVSLSGNPTTARGFSAPKMIIVDEAAFLDDDTIHALTPMLATGTGRMIMLSTPWGRRGHFFEAWEHGGDAWERIRVTADECHRISREFLAAEKASKPAWRYQSEYECVFCDVDTQLFGSDLIAAAISPDVAPLFDAPFVW